MKAKRYGMTESEMDEFIINSSNEELKEFQIKNNEIDIKNSKTHFYCSLTVAIVAFAISLESAFRCYGFYFLLPGGLSIVFGLYCWVKYNSWSASLMMRKWIKHFYKEMGI